MADLSIYLNNSQILLIQYTIIPQESQKIELFQEQFPLPPWYLCSKVYNCSRFLMVQHWTYTHSLFRYSSFVEFSFKNHYQETKNPDFTLAYNCLQTIVIPSNLQTSVHLSPFHKQRLGSTVLSECSLHFTASIEKCDLHWHNFISHQTITKLSDSK